MKVNILEGENINEIRLKLVLLGQKATQLDAEKNKFGIKKWFSLINSDENGDPYNICVILRENGETDFYYNFSLVEQNKEL